MPNRNKPVLEISVNHPDLALEAQRYGADRIELCMATGEGGLTPASSLMELVRAKINIGMHVMIRPRGGDFLYSSVEFEMMKRDIFNARQNNAAGIVVGILTREGSVDFERLNELIGLARPMKITFHRAFDMSSDPFLSLEALIECGVDSVLTSGQRQTAEDGLDLIKELAKRASGRIELVAASGVNASNVKLLNNAGVNAFHFTASKKVNSKMIFRNEVITSVGNNTFFNEYENYVFDEEKVSGIQTALGINTPTSQTK